MSQIKVNEIYDASGGSAAKLYGSSMRYGGTAFVNRIINGGMVIDQRNAGASVTPGTDGVYTLDRWQSRLSVANKFSIQQNAGAVTPPVGFSSYLGVTSLSAYTAGASEFFGVAQNIEGFNTADLGWGSAGAQSVTISFWVRSSLTGTFGGSIYNASGNRSHPFAYTITTSNTWEQKTVNVSGDAAGTWLTNNGTGLQIIYSLGAGASVSGTAGAWSGTLYRSATGATSVVGTNGATFYITGVQLEAGTVASPFERRDYGRELMMCQRYYQTTYNGVVAGTVSTSGNLARYLDGTTAYASHSGQFPVAMRATPTMAVYNPNTGAVSSMAADASNPAAVATALGPTGYRLYVNNVSVGVSVGLSAHYTANSEL